MTTVGSSKANSLFEPRHDTSPTVTIAHPAWLGAEGCEEWTKRWLQDNDVKNKLAPLPIEAVEEEKEITVAEVKVIQDAPRNVFEGRRGTKRRAEEELKKDVA